MPETAWREALSIRSDPALIREARLWVSEIARSAGLDEAAAHDLAVALSELCSNAHRHAYAGRTDGRIDLEAEVDRGGLKLTVRDYGIAFNLATYRAPELGCPAEGGYGVYLIRSLMDEVEFTATSAGTQVTIVKSRRSSRAAE